jgi:hypothetical protein
MSRRGPASAGALRRTRMAWSVRLWWCCLAAMPLQSPAQAPAGAASVPAASAAAPAPAATASAAPAAAASAPAVTVWLAGPEGSALTLDDALRQARDGEVIELLPGDYRGGLLIENRRLTLRGVQGAKLAVVKGDGKAGSAKALWTVRGGEVTLQNLSFRGARSSDGAGAGVRHEGGQLTLRGCEFFDNEYGVFSANDERAQLRIESSAFGMAPRVVGSLPHLLNVGRIAKLSVNGSRFQQGFEGHLIKTRARENLITYNFIHDGQRGGASYEIDIANGGLATVVGNVIGQGSENQNLVLVGYGTEDRAWDRNELVLAHNTFINWGWTPAWFLRVFSDNLPPQTEVIAVNNLLVGGGVFGWGAPGFFDGNRHARLGMLRDADTYAFELAPGSTWRSSGIDPRRVKGRDLSPKAEYVWPTGTQPVPADRSSWAPGAFQK